jgi:hypothetical protein
MQISKLSVAICATFVGVLPLAVHAADSEAQAKAREALEQALTQPTPQTTVITNPATTPKAAKPQKSAPAPAPAAAATAVATTSTPPVEIVNAPPGMSPENTERVRAALRQAQLQPVTPTKPQPVNPPVYVNHVNHVNPPGPPPVAQTTIVAPPLPISSTKEAQLQELLVRYKADQISPEDYHKERAKILAGP